jgi:hypothetical protein
MTHHKQTKKLTTWFLNLPLDESIDNKSIKFEVQIQQKPTKNKKNGKAKQNGKEELEKA